MAAVRTDFQPAGDAQLFQRRGQDAGMVRTDEFIACREEEGTGREASGMLRDLIIRIDCIPDRTAVQAEILSLVFFRIRFRIIA